MAPHKPQIPALSRRAALLGAGQALAVLAAACAPGPGVEQSAAGSIPSYTPAITPLVARDQGSGCAGALAATIPPTPIAYPGYTQVEPSTGLHVTAPPHVVELETYRLQVSGKVAREVSLTYDELRCLPKVSTYARIECPGFFVDWSNLAGASLASVLALAEPLEGAARVQFSGVDGRTGSCSLDAAQGTEYFLAYEWEGEPLPISHGFPVRAALTNDYGGSWVKWLQEIRVI